MEEKINRPNCSVIQPNCSANQPNCDKPTLTYGLLTNPDPLRAGRKKASLEFIITNPKSNDVPVKLIAFHIPVGSGGIAAKELIRKDYTISDDQNWSVNIDPPARGIAKVCLVPKNGHHMSNNASVSLLLYDVSIASSTGNAEIIVEETIGDPDKLTKSWFQVSIFPPDFFFDHLAANTCNDDKKCSQLTPVAQVDSGNHVKLTWNTSVSDLNNITIYWSDPAKSKQSAHPSEPGLWKSPELTCDTIFTVVATTHVDIGQPMTLSRSVVVSVRNPSLIAENIDAANMSIHTPYSSTHPVVPLLVRSDNPGGIGGEVRIANYGFGGNLDKAALSFETYPSTTGPSSAIVAQDDIHFSNHLHFQTKQSNSFLVTRAFIQSDGKVGINTINPESQLDVNGDASVSGALSANSAKISDSIAAKSISANGGANITGGLTTDDLIVKGKGGRTHICTLSRENGWQDTSVFSNNLYKYYELAINGVTPIGKPHSLGVRFYASGKMIINNNCSWFSYSNYCGGGKAENGSGESFLRLWPLGLVSDKGLWGVFGKVDLFFSDSLLCYTAQLFSPDVMPPGASTSGCQVLISGNSGFDGDDPMPSGIVVNYFTSLDNPHRTDVGEVVNGTVDIYGWN